MTGDPITHRLLQGIAVVLFGIALELAGGGVVGLLVAFIGLVFAVVTPSIRPRS